MGSRSHSLGRSSREPFPHGDALSVVGRLLRPLSLSGVPCASGLSPGTASLGVGPQAESWTRAVSSPLSCSTFLCLHSGGSFQICLLAVHFFPMRF